MQYPRAAAQSAPAFEVISVKPSQSGASDWSESLCYGGGRFISRGAPILWEIKWAFRLDDYQVESDWPAWLKSFCTYDIEAKAAGPVSEDECRAMLQALFRDRFKLTMHRETRTVSAYALVVARSERTPSSHGRVVMNGETKLATSERDGLDGWTMPRLANYLAGVRGIDRPVVDRTGLTGIYGFSLEYSARDGDDRPDIFSALPQ